MFETNRQVVSLLSKAKGCSAAPFRNPIHKLFIIELHILRPFLFGLLTQIESNGNISTLGQLNVFLELFFIQLYSVFVFLFLPKSTPLDADNDYNDDGYY